jgi:hypothetical protein
VNGKGQRKKYDVDDLDAEQSKIDFVVESGERRKAS